jgi:hypothetical protein
LKTGESIAEGDAMICDLWHGRIIGTAAALGLLSGVGLSPLLSATAQADWRQLAPWCAYMGASFGSFDCSYYTFAQCMATARGLGGYCTPNPRAAHDPYRRPRRARSAYQ